jgi:hypothetical protein
MNNQILPPLLVCSVGYVRWRTNNKQATSQGVVGVLRNTNNGAKMSNH